MNISLIVRQMNQPTESYRRASPSTVHLVLTPPSLPDQARTSHASKTAAHTCHKVQQTPLRSRLQEVNQPPDYIPTGT